MSVRETVSSHVITMLEGISVAAGYSTDFDKIYEWKVTAFEDSETSVNVKDTTDDIENELNNCFQRHTLHFTLEVSAFGADTKTTLRNAIQDIYTAVKDYPVWDNDKYTVYPEGDTMEVEHDEKISGVAVISLAIGFRTEAFGSSNIRQ